MIGSAAHLAVNSLMSEIQKADPGARRKAAWATLAAAVIVLVLVALFVHFEAHLYRWMEGNVHWLVSNPWVGFAVGLIMVVPVLLACGYLFVYGQRVVSAGRLPPPGYAVVRDVRVHVGSAAVVRGRALQALVLLLLAVALAIPPVLWWLLAVLGNAA